MCVCVCVCEEREKKNLLIAWTIILITYSTPSSPLRSHSPKGMEIVPWVGGPAILAKVGGNNGNIAESLNSDTSQMYVS